MSIRIVALAATLIALAVTGLHSAPELAAQVPVQAESGISVVGEGIVVAQPTQARVTFGVEVIERSLSAAQRSAASQMDAVVNRLLELGVDRSDIQTVRFSVQPEYNQQVRPPALVGFRVSNAVSAKLKDVNTIGTTLDAVVEAGAVRVNHIQFEMADPAALKDQAREQAMNNARRKAEQLARLSGVALGRPIRIEESDRGDVTPVAAAPAAREAMQATTPILPGELQVQTTVHVVYAIQ
jgi:uncharacterized protein YggE